MSDAFDLTSTNSAPIVSNEDTGNVMCIKGERLLESGDSEALTNISELSEPELGVEKGRKSVV